MFIDTIFFRTRRCRLVNVWSQVWNHHSLFHCFPFKFYNPYFQDTPPIISYLLTVSDCPFRLSIGLRQSIASGLCISRFPTFFQLFLPPHPPPSSSTVPENSVQDLSLYRRLILAKLVSDPHPLPRFGNYTSINFSFARFHSSSLEITLDQNTFRILRKYRLSKVWIFLATDFVTIHTTTMLLHCC